jgi:hypothetical protein
MMQSRLLIAALCLAGAGACDVGEPPINAINRGFIRPRVSVLSASVTTSYDADDRPVRSAMVEGGVEVTTGVPISASLVIRFNRFLLPTKVARQSLCIRPALDDIQSADQCGDPLPPFEAVEYNPVNQTATYRLAEGVSLAADTRYRVTIFVSEDLAQSGFFGFDGAPLDRRYVFDFETGPASSAVPEVLPGQDAYCAAFNCFFECQGSTTCEDGCRPLCVEPTCGNRGSLVGGNPAYVFQSCAFGSCHARLPGQTNATEIAMGLDLLSPGGLEQTAIGKTAHATQQGEAATIEDDNPARFGRAMPIVDPGNSGNSYLMYKLLANPLNYLRTSDGILADEDGNDYSAFGGEIDRLRKTVVVGLPMPAQQGKAGPPVGAVAAAIDPRVEASYERLMQIHAWIVNGAITDPIAVCEPMMP